MDSELFTRYKELQSYVGWSDRDEANLRRAEPLLLPWLSELVADFYREIEKHPAASQVIQGGEEQIARLKKTLHLWLEDLLHGPYDSAYVSRRWRVGWRHVEIGLNQVYTNVALSRLRSGLSERLCRCWTGSALDLQSALRSVSTLMDLDLAIIEDAYQTEYHIKKLAAAKERSEAAFRTLIEAAPCAILILRPDLDITYLSQYTAKLTGCSAHEALGRNYVELLVPEEFRDFVRAEIARVVSGSPSRGFEHPLLQRDGAPRGMVWNAQRLEDFQGSAAVIAVGQDITDLKQAQEKAVQAERLAAIGQMVAGLAHESGNALARSRACLDMLSWEVPDKPEVLDLIGRIQGAHNDLQRLYEEVRNYAGPLKLNREPWSVQAVWRQAWENLALARDKRPAQLIEEIDGVDTQCPIDPFRLTQVFRNIFENSLAAGAGPMQIQVHCAAAVASGREFLSIRVQDNGPGLTVDQKSRIFDPFYTTKSKGTGLGMAIAQRIVEAHGGTIAVGDGDGPGAEIVLQLPKDGAGT